MLLDSQSIAFRKQGEKIHGEKLNLGFPGPESFAFTTIVN